MELWLNKKDARLLLTILNNSYTIDGSIKAKALYDDFRSQLGDLRR